MRFDQIYTYSIIPPFTLPPTVLASSPDNSHKSSRIVSSQMNAWSGTIDVLRISRFSSSRMLLKMRFLTVKDVYETYLSAFILFLLIAGLKPVLLMLFLIFPLLGLLFWFSATGFGPVIVLLRLIGP